MSQKLTARHIALFIIALFFPMVLTAVYFVAGEYNASLQKGAYGIGKTIQFALPLVWISLILRRPWRLRAFSPKGFLEGGGFGLLVYSLIVALFWFGQDLPCFATELQTLREDLGGRMARLGLGTPLAFLSLGAFYCLIHSGLEEYYWRWFVFGELRNHLAWPTAAALASFGFILHHVLILACYFGLTGILTWLSVFGIFIGGFYWSWLYQRSDSIWGPWLSHGLIDAAIFTVGYFVLFGSGQPLV
ncbi:MAG: type II CAAX endopeptidase family protein [Planctomycetia bacterium]|nr:type II CAAX endopeptidase family protein [Planctomycetia bacterium]